MRPPIGIDIGVRSLHVAYAKGVKPAVVSLKEPDWLDQLEQLIPPGALVALEPTGWYYSAPILRALEHIGAQALIVEHSQTGHARSLHHTRVKTDRTDAHALRHIAANYETEEYIGVTPAELRSNTIHLRLRRLVFAYFRADKERTRASNRIRQLAYSMHPLLGLNKKSYMLAVRYGYVTPDELRDLARQIMLWRETPRAQRCDVHLPERLKDGRVAGPMLRLIRSIPDWLHEDDLRDIIAREGEALRYFARQRREIREQIQAEIEAYQPFARLAALWMTVPGASLTRVAAVISATHGHISKKPDQFRAAVGVHPKISQSGETAESVKSRPGFKPAKAALHLWTMTLITAGKTRPNIISETQARHQARGHKGAFFAARAKLANILWGMAHNNTPYIEKAVTAGENR